MTTNSSTVEEIYRLACTCAHHQKPYHESVWLLVNKDGDLKTYIADARCSEIRGLTGYCTVAVARNMRKPKPADIISEWAWDICGEELTMEDALDTIEREVEYMVSVLS
jgi:hypothetical protein